MTCLRLRAAAWWFNYKARRYLYRPAGWRVRLNNTCASSKGACHKWRSALRASGRRIVVFLAAVFAFFHLALIYGRKHLAKHSLFKTNTQPHCADHQGGNREGLGPVDRERDRSGSNRGRGSRCRTKRQASH
jgi:hypothetical protein